MPVMTKLYDDYATASRAAAEVDNVRLTGVETSIVGGEGLRDGYAANPYYKADTDSSATATGAGVGAAVGGGAGLLAGLGILAIPGVGPLVAAGWLVATAVGVAGGAAAGGTIGALLDIGISEDDVPVYSEAFRRGQVALSIRFPEDTRMSIDAALARVPDRDLADLRRRYEDDGWSHDETEAEREARLQRMNPPPMY